MLDVSRCERVKKEGRSYHEFSANMCLSELIWQLREILSVANYCVVKEVINVLENTKTTQYRNVTGMDNYQL